MASVNWEKHTSATDVKALLRHDDKELRAQTKEHSNKHIDKSKTAQNYSIFGRSYTERCQMYDTAIADAEAHSMCKGKPRKLRSTAVTCLTLETPAPAELPEERQREWFTRVHEIMCDTFGAENVIDTDVHLDEVHDYTEPESKERRTSRVHAHTAVIPRTPDGRLCCKDIYTRSAPTRLNQRIEDMTQAEFGVRFMTGEKVKSSKSVEQLKLDSAKAEFELEQAQTYAQIEQAAMQVGAERRRVKADREALRASESDLQARERALQAERVKVQAEQQKAVQAQQRASERILEAERREAEAEKLKAEYYAKIKQHGRDSDGVQRTSDAPQQTSRFDNAKDIYTGK